MKPDQKKMCFFDWGINSLHKTIGMEGADYCFQNGSVRSDYTESAFSVVEKTERSNLHTVVCNSESGFSLTAVTERCPETAVRRRKSIVQNTGDRPISFHKIDSLLVEGIAQNGRWYEEDRIRIHFARCTWQGEFQWKIADLKQYGLYPVSSHKNSCEIIFSSVGTWSTGRYYPLVLIEDTLEKRTYFFEVETSTSWQIVIFNSKEEGEIGSIGVAAGGANMLTDGWNITLQPGASYETVPVLFGAIEGTPLDALHTLITYKRKSAKASLPLPPVVYNCYLNGIWSHPTEERLLPIIDAAAEVGVEIFCIDAGWHSPLSCQNTKGIGDWEEDASRFPVGGLSGIIRHIQQRGMIPGLWMELEACQADCRIVAELGDDCFLTRNGLPIGKNRLLFNFSSQKVRRHLLERIEQLYQMGVRFIKNDYNQTPGIGFAEGNLSLSEALRRNSDAFFALIDEVRERFPDLRIENCASGAMRADHHTLSRFHTQSVSDQEIYYHMPAILSGAALCIPPEKLGIWSMPYPVFYKDRLTEINDAYCKAHFGDGMLRQTVFNLCNAFMGSVYLSGRIDCCDSKNKAMIQNAIAAYRSVRALIGTAQPVLPEGYLAIGEEKIYPMALVNESQRSAILSVWNLKNVGGATTVDLSFLPEPTKQVKPLCLLINETSFAQKEDKLSVSFGEGKAAATFLLEY